MQVEKTDGAVISRVFVPRLGVKKTVRLNAADTVWEIKMQFMQKLGLPYDETLNYGIYLPKAGVYLEEQRTLGSYYFSDNVYFEFKKKQREQSLPEKQVQKVNIPKVQKEFSEYVIKRQYQKMRLLASKGFDPNYHMDNAETPLTYAALNDDIDGVIALVTEMGSFIDFRTLDGKTPLHKAALGSHVGTLQLLLKYGSSTNFRDKNNLTPLYDASLSGAYECAQALLEANSPINVLDNQNRTELHQACSRGAADVAEILLEYGADINAVNEPGNTCLHMCASKNQLECAKILLRNGADKNILNHAGNTAFQLAVMFGNHEIAEFIETFNGPIVAKRKRKHDILFETDPGPNDFIPPPPPPGFEGISPAPKRAPTRRKVYSLLPPPPPPSSFPEESFGNNATDEFSDTSSLPSFMDLRNLPPPPTTPLPPPPIQFASKRS